MANPRKFSEKIALQKQKQAEGTAEFEKIMKEVYATKMDEGQTNQRVEENCVGSGNGLSTSYRESRGRSVGVGPMRRPSDRRVDRSPYSSANIAFLSPPSDSNWRRTNSDSAIHQSLQLTQDKHHGSHSPISLSPTTQRRTTQNNSNSDYMNAIAMSGNKNVSNMELRQGFETDMNNTYKSLHDNALFNVMANTGSLPDLTSVHFSTPINTTLEKEQQHSSSPFSSGQLTTSPTVLSPVTMCNRFQGSPAHSPSDSLTYSPTHYATNFSQVNSYPTCPSRYQNFNDNQFNQYRQTQNDQQSSHLSFTNLPGLINNQQGNGKNLNISNNNTIHGSHGHLSSIGITASGNLTEYRNSLGSPSPGSSPGLLPTNKESKIDSSCSPILVYNNKNSQIYNKQNQNNDGYAVNQSFQNHFEQFSLVDNTAPECTQNMRSAQNNYNDVQQQVNIVNNDCMPKISTPEPQFSEAEFEDGLLGRLSNHSIVNQQVPQYHHIRQQNDGGQSCNIMESGEKNDINVLSILGGNLKLENELTQDLRSHQFKNQQRANTPTIPAIVFSDFSSGNPDYTKEIFNSLDLELGPIDMAGLQMLSDPNSTMIADPTIEDSFRRDLT